MADTVTHLSKQEVDEGGMYAHVMRFTRAAAMHAASIDCGEDLALSAVGTSWYLVDLADEDNGYFPVVAQGYVDNGRLVAF
jgi:hypothetical protein